MQYEVTYRLLESPGRGYVGGASQYTTVVEAINQPAAEAMVKGSNGGSDHCQIIRTMYLG